MLRSLTQQPIVLIVARRKALRLCSFPVRINHSPFLPSGRPAATASRYEDRDLRSREQVGRQALAV